MLVIVSTNNTTKKGSWAISGYYQPWVSHVGNRSFEYHVTGTDLLRRDLPFGQAMGVIGCFQVLP